MPKSKRTGLGKGLGAFFGDEATEEIKSDNEETAGQKEETIIIDKVEMDEAGKELFIKLSLIEPNRDQPRKDFNEEMLQELAESIKQYGVLQPLLVQKKGDYYEIIAGERRWRAAKIAGLKEIPVVIREYSKQESVEIALIENVQREDLNPIEEAMAYQQLMSEFGLKQDEIAARVSKSRVTITNSMRLLKLDSRVRDMVIKGELSSGHARAILAVEDHEEQFAIAQRVVKDRLSVREIEKLVKLISKGNNKKEKEPEDQSLTMIFQELENKMKTIMGTKVSINKKDKNKGRIEIEYYSAAELERLVDLIESIQ